MSRSVSRTTIFLLSMAICAITRAQVPANPFADQIQNHKDMAAVVLNELTTLGDTSLQLPGYTERDMLLITPALNEVADTYVKAAAALDKGDEAGAKALAKRVGELYANHERWGQRLECRRRQSQVGEYLPATEDSFDWLSQWAPTEFDVQPIVAFMEAKKRRCEANGRLADAMTPTADPQLLLKLQDEVFATETEVQVADMKVGWSREDLEARVYVLPDHTVASPDLTAAKERLVELRRQREDLLRQSRTITHSMEQQPRQYAAIIDARNKAYRVAKAAKDAEDAKVAEAAKAVKAAEDAKAAIDAKAEEDAKAVKDAKDRAKPPK